MSELLQKHVFYSRSERTDEFSGKRYTNPECIKSRHILIMAKVVAVKNNQVMLRPTQSICGVPDEFVVYQEELSEVSGSIRTLEDHGKPNSIVNEWVNK